LAPGTDLFNGDFFDFGSLSLSDFDQALGDNTHININA
jgi:hypothetical protein